MEKQSRLTPARAAYLAWEEISRAMAQFAAQEKAALKQHKSVRDIQRARQAYMTSLLKGQNR